MFNQVNTQESKGFYSLWAIMTPSEQHFFVNTKQKADSGFFNDSFQVHISGRGLLLHHPPVVGRHLRVTAWVLRWRRRQGTLEELLVERGEDQLVEVDQAAETDSELPQLLAHRGQAAGQRGRSLGLSGLQGGQHVAGDAGLCVQECVHIQYI